MRKNIILVALACLMLNSSVLGLVAPEFSCARDDARSPGLADMESEECSLWDFGIPDPQPLSYYNKSMKLDIHLIPHTHNDLGWLKTVDEYFYGTFSNITYAGVEYILDSVVSQLLFDTSRKFIYVESGFFIRWWNEQKETTKAAFRLLIARGQLVFINGGWVMNDEACVYYEDSIDQMTLGHRFLLETFNFIPTVAWHIDPFGHASAQAAMYAQMGFQAFFFARIDYQDKQVRLNNSAMEMVWVPETSQGIENAIFTHVNYYHYVDPRNYCFDIRCAEDAICNDPRLEGYNVDVQSDGYVAWFRQQAQHYRTSTLMHTVGTDFAYQAANINFKNMEKMIDYINAHPEKYNVNIKYSHPTTYISTINPMNKTYPFKYDDFFPYADEESAYWTGYFSSRVAMKGLVRKTGRFFQAIKKLSFFKIWTNSSQFIHSNFSKVEEGLHDLETAMGVAQHHDAVTGTEAQFVTFDYQYFLAAGQDNAERTLIFPILNESLIHDLGISAQSYATCMTNISASFCNATYQNLPKGIPVLMSILNPAESRTSTVRVKVPNGNVQVLNSTGATIPTDIICSNLTDATDCDLFFTSQFVGYSINYFYLKPIQTSNKIPPITLTKTTKSVSINSEQVISVTNLNEFSVSNNGIGFPFKVNYNYYNSYEGDPCNSVSGAYIFRPANNCLSDSLTYTTPQNGSVYLGENLLMIQVYYGSMISNMRIYNDVNLGIEIETFINSIPYDTGSGIEVVIQIETNIDNNKTFYTDSMGMELQKRITNFRPTWNLDVFQNVSGNYYPVQSALLIEDYRTGATIGLLPDRSEGGGSIGNGKIELMMHRRITEDDGRGVNEPLDELDWDGYGLRQWVTHQLVIDNLGDYRADHRLLQYNNDQPNIVFFTPVQSTPFKQVTYNNPFNNIDLDYIKILARPWNSTTINLRFHNMDETNNRTVPTSIFQTSALGAATVTEMSLSFNQDKASMIKNKLNWNGQVYNNPAFINTDYLTSSEFTLRPLEIRTFKVQFSKPVEPFEFDEPLVADIEI